MADNSGVHTYYLQDGLGSTTGLTDDGGVMTATYQYDAFGAVKTKTGTGDTAYRFTGEVQDYQVARQPMYLRARYYDPALGRDPWPASAMSPQSLNRYIYVYNNPILLVDPLGLMASEGGPFCSTFRPTPERVPTPPPVTPTPKEQYKKGGGLWGAITGAAGRAADAARSTLEQQACSGTFGALTGVTCPLFSPAFEPARGFVRDNSGRALNWLFNTCEGDITRAAIGIGLAATGVGGMALAADWGWPLVQAGGVVGFASPTPPLSNCY